ncbi:MAG: PAS domain-containing protein [Planktothrix sp. GU0601_MAG3]|nr:MAG: PAS domain-containing protein [Planktothrix sp. GU0601_MAG3]
MPLTNSMQKPDIPANESDPLVALDRYKILDTLPEQVYDDPLKNAVGEVVGASKIVCDISDCKQAELQLQKTTERLVFALKSGAIGCWEYDIQQNLLVWDDRMFELYGYLNKPNPHLVYEIWANAIHPDDRNATETLLQQAFLGVAEYDCEFRIIHSDGSIHFIKAYGMVKLDAQSKPERMIGINFDISDRKQAEQIILQQANRETLLRGITQRIRQSLDLSIIFDTACQEIQLLLQCDRVGIFKFYPESNFDDGEFVAESVVDGFSFSNGSSHSRPLLWRGLCRRLCPRSNTGLE